jgi:hypothetical protein
MLYPINKRSQEHLLQRLKEEGLEQILNWQNSQRSTAVKNDLSQKLVVAFQEGMKPSEVSMLTMIHADNDTPSFLVSRLEALLLTIRCTLLDLCVDASRYERRQPQGH